MKNKISQIFLLFLSIVLAFLQYSCKDDTIIQTDPNTITVYDVEPAWSPDGNSIAYGVSNVNDGSKILAIDINSTNKRTLVQVFGVSLCWSPDGQWILYESGGIIYKKHLENDTVTIQLTFNGNCFHPSWSKDGEWIAYDSNLGTNADGYFIWKMRADGTQKKRIIFTPELGEVRAPDWFPDGIRLAVSRYFPGHGAWSEIAIIDTSGNSLGILTNDNEPDDEARVSSDGQFITWWKSRGIGRIFTMKTDGSEQRQIITNAIHPNWSPNSNMICYTNTNFNDGRIWIMNMDGSSRKKISY